MECSVRCFICGIKIGKGNQPSLGVHERIEKLISVSQTVEHSSTIISDILSRILNETVMREETICRVCFNLLNDIDYHLKEAQEKTDEITNKFLDKEKDPLSYRRQPIVSVEKDVAETTELSLSPHKQNVSHNKENIQRSSKRKSASSKATFSNDTDSTLTEDEMSVNIINRNKAKLLSHVLNPNKKLRKIEFKDSEEEEEDESKAEKEEEKVERSRSSKRHKKAAASKSKKHSKSSKSQRRKNLTTSSDDDDDDDEVENEKARSKSASKADPKRVELTTVNMDELTDLFSKPKVYFAKKSHPEESSRNATAHSTSKSSVKPTAQPAVQEAALVDDKQPVTCELCFKTFKRGTNLQLHKEKMHSLHEQPTLSNIPESHKCSLCPREFTNIQSLAAHEMEHEDLSDSEKPVVEKKASKPAKPDSGGEAKAVCPICSKTFRRLFNMRTHINRVHDKVKPFACSICEKSFATNSDLKQHMVVHGQGKMFTCETCGREFSNRDSIILHRKQHTQQKTHFCQICKKGFYKASCLNRHLRSHTGERPFTCQRCHKSFSQSTSLKSHVAKCNGKSNKANAEDDDDDADYDEAEESEQPV